MAKCPPCKKGAPDWLATFSDLCTLLLTFFILLISMATFEKIKLQKALGSIRQAFGGQVRVQGETVMLGKTPENYFVPLDAADPPKPFPIEFLTTEGLLNEHEIYNNAEEEMANLTDLAKEYDLADQLQVHEHKDGINVKVREQILFEPGSVKVINFNTDLISQIAKLAERHGWHLWVQGIINKAEPLAKAGSARELAFRRANTVGSYLEKIGVPGTNLVVSTVEQKADPEYGRVEIILKKQSTEDLGKEKAFE